MTIYEAAMRYADEGVELVVLAGREYGTGSSRDWAAKGTRLLGVRAVIADSFERIHRSNLIGMGVLPLQFPAGESAGSLGLDRRGALLDRGSRGGERAGRADALPAACAGPRGRGPGDRVRRPRADRHPPGGGILPPRRDPAVRAARSAGQMSPPTRTDTRKRAPADALARGQAARAPSAGDPPAAG